MHMHVVHLEPGSPRAKRETRSVLSSHNHRVSRSPPGLEIRPLGRIQQIQAGKSFVLNCLGVGESSNLFTDLTWYNPRGERITSSNDFSVTLTNGGDRQMLVFKNPQVEDEGTYKCKGFFMRTNPVEAEVEVSIFEGISFEDCPEVQALVKGRDQQVIGCRARSKPSADVTWLKDDKTLDKLRYYPTTEGLQIRGTSDERDSGKYIIMAAVTETGLVEMKEITVETHVRPEIVDFNLSPEAVEGENTTLDCKARATPHARYDWLDPAGKNLSATPGYTVLYQTGELKIETVTRDMNLGPFTCVASNAAGEDRRKSFLKIITKPIITRMDSISLVEEEHATIVCVGTGNPLPTLSIRREGHQMALIPEEGRLSVSPSSSETESRLEVTISSVRKSDAGLYFCSAENPAGSNKQSGHIQVEYRPDLSQTEREVKSWMGNTVNITCIVDGIPNATLHWYDVKNNRLTDGTNPSKYKVFTSLPKGQSILQVTCSDKDVYSTYRCHAQNKHGEGSEFISLKEAFVPGPIPAFYVVKRSPQSLTFKIEDPVDDGGLPITYYTAYYRDVGPSGGGGEGWREHTWPTAGSLDKSYFIDGLRSQSVYEFRFTAQNAVGEGPTTQAAKERLPLESQPEPVRITPDDPTLDANSGDVMSRFSRQFTLKWTEPPDNGRKIELYEIKYYKVKKSETFGGDWTPVGTSTHRTVAAGDELSYTLGSLEPSTFYRVEISAKNELGSSHPTSLVFRTADFADGTDSDGLGVSLACPSFVPLNGILLVLPLLLQLTLPRLS